MSRAGYSDDIDNWDLIRWRGAVASAIRGKRGQAFLQELMDALLALPEKRLIAHTFGEAGSYCTLGVIAAKRGVEMPVVDPDEDMDYDEVRQIARERLGIPGALAAEIMFLNDDSWYQETPEHRYDRMLNWVRDQIKVPT